MEPVFVEELPDHGNTKHPWVEILKPLMNRPGVWALIAQYDIPHQAASQVTNLKRVVHKLPGLWEFVSRSKDGKGNIYARYLGPDN